MVTACATTLPAQLATGLSTRKVRESDAPSGLAFGGGHIWVTNEAGDSVSEINPPSGSWIATLSAATNGFRRP